MSVTPPTIAYILKGYPRNSEVFITNEIHLLESMGLRLHIFSAFQPTDLKSHSVVKNIHANVTYLPEDDAATDRSFGPWLVANIPRYLLSHLRLFASRPWTYIKTAWEALRLSFHCRSGWKPFPKKVFYKDFLRAGAIAQGMLTSNTIRHLHAHFCHGSTTMAMFASQMTGVPFSFTAHAKDIYLPKLNPGDLLKYKMERSKFVVTCTDANRQYLQTILPHQVPIHTIYHGLNTAVFAPTDSPTKDIPTILSVGRFVEKKGFAFLVHACRILHDRGHVFRCHIVGEPDEQSEPIQTLIRTLQLEATITIESGRTQEELRSIYQQAAIFTLPCQIMKNGDRDGIPNVLAEAMASGVPVVSTNISGIPELITSRIDGLLVPQKDPSALAQALEELLVNPSLREQLGQAGRERICKVFDSKINTIMLKTLFLASLENTQDPFASAFSTTIISEKS